MRKQYIKPQMSIHRICGTETILSGSNTLDGKSINFNPDTMTESDGSDAAVKSNTYSVWDDIWE